MHSEIETECEWLPLAREQFEAIARLPRGWDSHEAEPPEPSLVDAGSRLLHRLCEVAP